MGTVAISRTSVVETQKDCWSLTGRRRYRLKVTNRPHLEIEVSAGNDPEKAEWLTVLRECVESAQSGNTPVSLLLKQLGRDSSEPTVARERLQTMQRDVRRTKRRELADEDRMEETAQRSEDECPYDNMTFNLQKDKLKMMFIKIDKKR